MMPWTVVGNALTGIMGLADQYILDKDKLIEFRFRALELNIQAQETLLKTNTTPWVDAVVKLMYALNMFWRPFVGAAMTAFGAYCHYKGIEMDAALHAVFDGAFPAWGASRHMEKIKNADKKAGYSGFDEDY